MAKLKKTHLPTIRKAIDALGVATTSGDEFGVLDGLTASTAELNATDGVTSAIQTQINNITFNSFSKNIVKNSGPGDFLTYSTSFLAIPGTSLVITPTSVDSRIILWWKMQPHLNCGQPVQSRHFKMDVFRNRSGESEVNAGTVHTERTTLETQGGQYMDKTKSMMHIDHPNTAGAAVTYHVEGIQYESGRNAYYSHSYAGDAPIKALAVECYTTTGQSYNWDN